MSRGSELRGRRGNSPECPAPLRSPRPQADRLRALPSFQQAATASVARIRSVTQGGWFARARAQFGGSGKETKSPTPKASPAWSTLSLFQANLLGAMLAGFWGHKGDGQPGPKRMAAGLEILAALVEFLEWVGSAAGRPSKGGKHPLVHVIAALGRDWGWIPAKRGRDHQGCKAGSDKMPIYPSVARDRFRGPSGF